MAANQVGRQTITFGILPRLVSMHTIVGTLEGKGPYGGYFHEVLEDDLLGQKTAEKAERQILENAVNEALRKGGLVPQDVQYYISGDLLNQVISAVFSARSLGVPFLGIFSACGTFAQAWASLASCSGRVCRQSDGGHVHHYQTAERQYRYPIELNIQHPHKSAYGNGSQGMCLGHRGEGPKITMPRSEEWWIWVRKPNDMGVPWHLQPLPPRTARPRHGQASRLLRSHPYR